MNRLTYAAARKAVSVAIDVALKKVEKDRDKALCDLVSLIANYMKGDQIPFKAEDINAIIMNKESSMRQFIDRVIDEVDHEVLKKMFLNLGFTAFFHGAKKIRRSREKYQCNVPWLIIMDPTSACNLHCTGCWAAEYGNKLNLTFEEMDSIVKQGKELGTYFYLFTGGEPLVRKADLIKLCEKHNDCAFMSFTNGTLIDQAFCDEMKRVGNLMLQISLEGDPSANDLRRGEGVYGKVMAAMDLLKQNGLIFGTSVCYTSKNYESVTSDEFFDLIKNKGCRLAMYFHYMPVGKNADTSLLLTPEQRLVMIDRIRSRRNLTTGRGIFAMDFQNDGEYVGGCIAGGRNYFHINANGDCEPCVFIHYSDSNIREKTILEALQSPLFQAYRDNQPFNNNHLRPCPMLENPEILGKMVRETGAHSTEMIEAESPEDLALKCIPYANSWKPTAEDHWNTHTHVKKKYENYKKDSETHKLLDADAADGVNDEAI